MNEVQNRQRLLNFIQTSSSRCHGNRTLFTTNGCLNGPRACRAALGFVSEVQVGLPSSPPIGKLELSDTVAWSAPPLVEAAWRHDPPRGLGMQATLGFGGAREFAETRPRWMSRGPFVQIRNRGGFRYRDYFHMSPFAVTCAIGRALEGDTAERTLWEVIWLHFLGRRFLASLYRLLCRDSGGKISPLIIQSNKSMKSISPISTFILKDHVTR